MERERTMYRSLLMQAGALQADPRPTPLRLVRASIAMRFTAGLRAMEREKTAFN